MSVLHCHRHFDCALQRYGRKKQHFPFIADQRIFCCLLRISNAFFHSQCKDTAETEPFQRTSVRFLFVFANCYAQFIPFPCSVIRIRLQRYNFSHLRIGLRRVTTGFAGTNADKSTFVPYLNSNWQIVQCPIAKSSAKIRQQKTASSVFCRFLQFPSGFFLIFQFSSVSFSFLPFTRFIHDAKIRRQHRASSVYCGLAHILQFIAVQQCIFFRTTAKIRQEKGLLRVFAGLWQKDTERCSLCQDRMPVFKIVYPVQFLSFI